MDMSFANQALATEYAVQNAASLEQKVYPVPTEIDEEIARLKLATMGVDDRPAHRGAGEVPRLVGRRHLIRSSRRSSRSLSRVAAARGGAATGTGARCGHQANLAPSSGPVAFVALDRAPRSGFRRMPRQRVKLARSTSRRTRSSRSSASSAAATTGSSFRRSRSGHELDRSSRSSAARPPGRWSAWRSTRPTGLLVAKSQLRRPYPTSAMSTLARA